MASSTREEILETLRGFVAHDSVSGDEQALAEHLAAAFRAVGATRVEIDRLGNLLAWKGENPRRAVVAHLDTVGFMVEAVEKDHCPLAPVGFPSPGVLQRAVLTSRGGERVPGLVTSAEGGKKPYFEPLDPSRLELVEIGDRVAYAQHLEVDGDYLLGPYLDNRLGCWMALEALARSDELLAVCTVQEETTCAGAYQVRGAMNSVESVLVVDVTYAREPRGEGRIELGEGPVLSLLDQNLPSRRATEAVREAARRSEVELQLEVTDAGSSDMVAFLQHDRPRDCCFFGVASRYNHQPFELVHLGDLEQAGAVVSAWASPED